MWNSLSGSLSHYLPSTSAPASTAIHAPVSEPAHVPSTPRSAPLARVEGQQEDPERGTPVTTRFTRSGGADNGRNNKPSLAPTRLGPLPDGPRTPAQSRPRLSPKSLSASGNQTMAGVLAAHPQFSVFRKSTSRDGLDELLRNTSGEHSPLEGTESAAGTGKTLRDGAAAAGDENLVETLATPPAASPRSKRLPSPSGNSSGSSSFHLSSLEGADLPSLNFGDHSSSASLVGVSPRASPSLSSSPASSPLDQSTSSNIVVLDSASSSVRLIPDSPPTTRRSPTLAASSSSFQPSIPTSISRPTRTPSRSSSSSSLSRSQSVARVGQFSPLSLCPSPLIGAPTLPPPPPPPTLSLDDTNTPQDEGCEIKGLRRTSSILKLPRTPGTGRSVRFTDSIIDHGSEQDSDDDEGRLEGDDGEKDCEGDIRDETFERDESPSIHPGSRQHRIDSSQRGETDDEERDQTGSALDLSAMSSKDDISTARAGRAGGGGGGGGGGQSSFLDKLKQVIPSPDVSLVEPEPECRERDDMDPAGVTGERGRAIHEADREGPESTIYAGIEGQASVVGPSVAAQLPSPPRPTPVVSDVDPSLSSLSIGLQPSVSQSNMLFDESNPCPWTNESVSVLGSSTTLKGVGGTIGGPVAMEVLAEEEEEEEEEEDEDEEEAETSHQATTILPNTPRAIQHHESFDLSRTPTSGKPNHARSRAAEDEVDEDSPLDRPESEVDSPIDDDADARQGGLERTINDVRNGDAGSRLDSASTAAAARTPPTEPSQSFYRRFMATRATLGGSQTAAEEWDRLETGEKASPKEQQRPRSVEPDADDEGPSVYYSPERERDHEEGDQEDELEIEKVLVQGGSFYELAPGAVENEQVEEEASMVDFGGTFLSPIAELSEPESTANSPLLEELVASLRRSRTSRPPIAALIARVPPSQPEFVPTADSAAPSTLSRIPRPRRPIPVAESPFVLRLDPAQLSGTVVPPAFVEQARMVQQLVSTQQDQLALTAHQRSLLSRVVTGLQREVEHKSRMVDNLKRQVVQAREEVRQFEQLAHRARATRPDDRDEARERERDVGVERGKVIALEETVRLLADELDTRLREGGTGTKKFERELERTTMNLERTRTELNATEARLRHAQSSQVRAEDEARRSRFEVDRLTKAWQSEVEERDRTVERLRAEVLELRNDSDLRRETDSEDQARMEREIKARLDEATRGFEKQSRNLKRELVARDEALAQLRLQLAQSRDEVAQPAALAAKDVQLQDLQDANSELQDELDATVVKLEDARIDRDRLARLLEEKEVELIGQQDQYASAISAMKDLELAVTGFEREAARNDAEFAKVNTQLELQTSVVSVLTQDKGVLQRERDKACLLAEKLKRESADREIRIAKLKKRVAELDEDVFGLNIALDAKQQEASHWKRQMSQAKTELERATGQSAILPSSTAARFHNPSTTVRRSSSTSSVRLSSLADPHSTPSAAPGSKRATRLSRQSSRSHLASSTASISSVSASAVYHDLSLPDPEETPSRLPPFGNPTTSMVANAVTGFEKSSTRRTTRAQLGLVQFPNVPDQDPTRSGAHHYHRERSILGVTADAQASAGADADAASKENEPPRDGIFPNVAAAAVATTAKTTRRSSSGSRRTSSSRRRSTSEALLA